MSTLSMRNSNILGENQNHNGKENARPKNGKAGGSKRTALGCVTNQVRVQPLRAAKDKHTVLGLKSGQENAMPQKKAFGSSAFSIFQDAAPVQAKATSSRVPPILHEPMCEQDIFPESKLNAGVLSLNAPSLRTLAPLSVTIPEDGSPMAIDSPSVDASPRSKDEFGLEEYYSDIYEYLQMKETQCRPSQHYMSRQSDVTTSMRNILVDWLVEVGEEYKLHRETLHLAVSYIDMFLSLVRVHRPKLQLVGTAAMFIASKYEEIYPPDVGEFVYITDDTYSKSQVLKMESVILKMLEFKVAMPTINWFAEKFMDGQSDMSNKTKSLAFFLCELTLIEVEEFLAYRGSLIAAAAVCLARLTVGLAEHTPAWLLSASGYTRTELAECVRALHSLHQRAPSMAQQAVVEKYKQPKYDQAALLTALPALHLD